MTKLIQGQKVESTCNTAVCANEEPGVCIKVYNLDGQEVYMVLFKDGDNCGYGEEEVDSMLLTYNDIDHVAESYEFTNAVQLDRDYRDGVFRHTFDMFYYMDGEDHE